ARGGRPPEITAFGAGPGRARGDAMPRLRWLYVVGTLAAVYASSGCASDTCLNPQPEPPCAPSNYGTTGTAGAINTAGGTGTTTGGPGSGGAGPATATGSGGTGFGGDGLGGSLPSGTGGAGGGAGSGTAGG